MQSLPFRCRVRRRPGGAPSGVVRRVGPTVHGPRRSDGSDGSDGSDRLGRRVTRSGGQRPGRRLLFAVVSCLLAWAGVLLAGAAPAGAHAALVGSDPKQGAVLATAPEQVSLAFSEQVAMDDDSVRVLDPDGRRVSTGKATAESDTYRIRLRTGLPHGTYTVAYQLVSADSHPISGAFTFSVGAPSATSVSLPEDSTGGGLVGGLYDTVRYVSYAGFILLAGGTAFVLACWPRGARERSVRRLVVTGWVGMTAATLAQLLMRGAYAGSGEVADIADLGLLGDVLHTRSGTALVCRLVLLAVAALFVAVLFGAYAKRIGGEEAAAGQTVLGESQGEQTTPGSGQGEQTTPDRGRGEQTTPDRGRGEQTTPDRGRGGRTARSDLAFGLALGGVVVAIGLAATWAMSEHASVGIQTQLAMPVDIVHLLAVAAWLGGLAALLTALYRVPSVEAAAVRRFSALAFGSVLALVATGVYQSWRQVGSWSALTGTSFGQLLLVKVGLVAVVVLVASSSRRWTGRLTNAATDPAADPAAAEDADTTPESPSPEHTADRSPQRTAQLARQQAAKDVVRRRRTRDADPARSALRRSVLAEAVVAVVVLAVTTLLTSTETGRTQEQVARAADAAAGTERHAPPVSFQLPYDTGGGAHGRGSVMVDLAPSHPGSNNLQIMVMDSGDQAVDIPEVRVRLTLAAQHLGPLQVPLKHTSVGIWTAQGMQIPMAGDWRFDVTVRTSDIDEVTVHKNARIG